MEVGREALTLRQRESVCVWGGGGGGGGLGH